MDCPQKIAKLSPTKSRTFSSPVRENRATRIENYTMRSRCLPSIRVNSRVKVAGAGQLLKWPTHATGMTSSSAMSAIVKGSTHRKHIQESLQLETNRREDANVSK
jgi:hypothetical protein